MTIPVPTADADAARQKAAPPGRLPKVVRLGDVGIAGENMRAGEPPDEDIPQLAETIKAAGLMHPLTVRPGRGRREKRFMALDGRRRLLALALLLEAGEITEDHAVEVFEETDPARQAAAVLLTNTAVPVHIADVVGAIGKMLKAKLTVAVIARALGYGEIEIKRLAALAALPSKAIQALKLGRLTLKQARLLARLPDRREQKRLAEDALAGLGLPTWRLAERLDDGAVTGRDRRVALVGADRYAAAGGQTESDLFGELPDRWLDPAVLSDLWLARAGEVARRIWREGLTVHLTADASPELAQDLEDLAYAPRVKAEDQQAHALARERLAAAVGALREIDLSADEALEPLAEMARLKLAADEAGAPGEPITVVVISPAAESGLAIRCYAPVEPEIGADELSAEEMTVPRPLVVEPPVADHPAPETDGVSHALHETRTDAATRGLMRALADDPATALIALTARLFTMLALRAGLQAGSSALTVGAQIYGRPKSRVIDVLDGEVRRRLEARRAAWVSSGLTPIAWIAALPHGEKMALLAELTAISLDLREDRTTSGRFAARGEAAEIARLCDADIATYWTPDEPYLRVHSKAQLLSMLVAMGAEDERAKILKKGELVDWVAEQAAERDWAPACLSWSGPAASDDAVLNEDAVADPGSPAPDAEGDPAMPIAA